MLSCGQSWTCCVRWRTSTSPPRSWSLSYTPYNRSYNYTKLISSTYFYKITHCTWIIIMLIPHPCHSIAFAVLWSRVRQIRRQEPGTGLELQAGVRHYIASAVCTQTMHPWCVYSYKWDTLKAVHTVLYMCLLAYVWYIHQALTCNSWLTSACQE